MGWKDSLNQIIKQHNGYTADGNKVASYATQKQRCVVLYKGFRDLRQLGFKFKTVRAFGGRHMQALARKWEEEGLSASSLQNRISVFRIFAHWIGKNGMILPPDRYVCNPDRVKRSYVASETKTWHSQGVDYLNKIKAIRSKNKRFSDALELQRQFGLRSKESLLLRPHLSDKGQVLVVMHGTKGGRTRYVAIETEEQRTLLNRIKGYIKRNESLVPRDKTYGQFRNQYYYVLRKHGISRDKGITAHGLRHEHLNELYHKTNQELDSFGRKLVSERAGHSRESIASAYIGGKKS